MRIQKLGHACLSIEEGTGDSAVKILIDPGVWSEGFEELRGLSAVLVTHQHPDHLDVDRVAALLEANPEATLYIDSGTEEKLAAKGIDATVVSGGQTFDIAGVKVETVGDQHAVIHADIPRVPNVGYLVAGRLFHPGDALTVPRQPVELLALPTGAPWTKSGEVVDYLRAVSPRLAFPIHERTLAFPQMEYGRYAQLAPEGTEVRPIDGADPQEV